MKHLLSILIGFVGTCFMIASFALMMWLHEKLVPYSLGSHPTWMVGALLAVTIFLGIVMIMDLK